MTVKDLKRACSDDDCVCAGDQFGLIIDVDTCIV